MHRFAQKISLFRMRLAGPPSRLLWIGVAVAALLAVALALNATRVGAVPNPLASQTLFGRLLQPFVSQAETHRAWRARNDPGYAQRIDHALASGRVNFLLFGYGETLEPPFKKALIGSFTLVSFNTRTGAVDLISLTHDVRAPEVERELEERGVFPHAVKIDQAYDVGGFDLMRETVEDATGLPVDFQVSFRDVVIQKLVDSVFEQVSIDVPYGFDTAPFYLDGQAYGTMNVARGLQSMNGKQVIQFMKSLEAASAQTFQRNARKELVLKSLLGTLTERCSDRRLWLKLSAFLMQEQWSGDITYDFDTAALLINNLAGLGSSLPDLLRAKTCTIGAPQIARTLYIVDPQSGGDGVRWASSDATLNPIARNDITSGVYEADGLGVAVPLNGNPYGNLVSEYWGSVRNLVRETLLKEEQ